VQDWLAPTRDFVREVLRTDARELEVAREGYRLRILRRPAMRGESGTFDGSVADGRASLAAIRAPLTGVFYGGPSPGASRYVQVGELISVGTVVGLIEAMKVFNEVLADVAGTIRQVVAADGSLVRAGEELILIDPGESAPSSRGARE
jgi:acetyl-CoA carboxylase biotin carboxyl carrier protein